MSIIFSTSFPTKKEKSPSKSDELAKADVEREIIIPPPRRQKGNESVRLY